MARVPWLNLRVFADLELEARRRSSPTEPKRRVMWHFCPPFDDCGANHPLVMAHEPRAVCQRQQTFCSHHPSCIPRGRKTWQSFAWLAQTVRFSVVCCVTYPFANCIHAPNLQRSFEEIFFLSSLLLVSSLFSFVRWSWLLHV